MYFEKRPAIKTMIITHEHYTNIGLEQTTLDISITSTTAFSSLTNHPIPSYSVLLTRQTYHNQLTLHFQQTSKKEKKVLLPQVGVEPTPLPANPRLPLPLDASQLRRATSGRIEQCHKPLDYRGLFLDTWHAREEHYVVW
jgi:hypothetical protein